VQYCRKEPFSDSREMKTNLWIEECVDAHLFKTQRSKVAVKLLVLLFRTRQV
jgi:hypothetical protein